MIKDELSNEYFEWLYQLVCDDRGSKSKAQTSKVIEASS